MPPRSLALRVRPVSRLLRGSAALALAVAVGTCGGDGGPTGVDVAAIVFGSQPGGSVAAGAPIGVIRVQAQSSSGGVVSGYGGTVTIAITSGTGAPGATLAGTKTVAASNGVATFSDLSIDKVGTGYKLTASAPGLTPIVSGAFDVTPGPLSQFAFTVQPPPNAVAGAPLAPAVQVTGRDAFGNAATGFSGDVTVALGTNPTGATLSGTTTVAAVGGVATFADLSIKKSGSGYTLTASATGVTPQPSAAFNVVAGPATQLAFTVQPSNTDAGISIAPAVQVSAQDALGNTATTFNGAVNVSIGTNPVGGALLGTATVNAVNGVATFANLRINKSGSGYTLAAASVGLSPAGSALFDVGPAPASQLEFAVQPADATAGGAIAPAVEVTVLDAVGNVATGYAGNVTVAIGTNPGGGTLSGTTTVPAVSGVARFASLSVDKSGNGYTLTATSGTLASAVSTRFNIAGGPAAAVSFAVQPGNAAAGVAITPAVVVTAHDALGNLAATFTGDVTVTIGANPGGGTLSGNATVAAVNGVATFANLRIDKTGTGYTLQASSVGLAGSAVSSAFNVAAGPATQLFFSTQPSTVTAGVAIAPAVVVAARDSFGNPTESFGPTVTVALAANPGGGTLNGTLTVGVANGAARFTNLNIDRSGSGYTLTAMAGALTPAISGAFDVAPATASQLVFTDQPNNATAGQAIAPAVRVTARDALGNAATAFTGPVTVALGVNPGGGALGGTTTVAAVNGVATFADLSINRSATGYRLAASSSGLTNGASATFDITAGPATELFFAVQPNGTTAGAPIAPPIQVSARDALGNTDPTFTGDVAVALAGNPMGGTLSGTTTVAAVNGMATFATLAIDKSGAGYTLAASAAGLSADTSATFAVAPGAATQLAFTAQPTNATAGETIAPPVRVTARDAQGNTATGFTGAVTVAIENNAGGGTLSGAKTVAAVAGVATFADLAIDKSGTGYTLSAASGGLSGATSAPFAIGGGSARSLTFTVPPVTTTAGQAIPTLEVTARDAQGNVAVDFGGDVTVSIAGTGGGGTLSGTATVAAVSGVATFSGLSIDKSGVGYTLAASAAGLAGATSDAFAITPAAAVRLAFTTPPVTTTAGQPITPAVQVTARDAFDNDATAFTGAVTITFGANPAGGTLAGATVQSAVAGVATFGDLSIAKVGSGYALAAAAGGLVGDSSGTFDITPGPAARLAFTVQPTNQSANLAIAPPVQVTARDAHGNVATGFGGVVTMAIGSNPGTGSLNGVTGVTAVAGVATFNDLRIDQGGSGYTLTASGTGLTAATSDPFDIIPAVLTRLVFAIEPTTTVAGTPFTPAVRVEALDALDHLVPGFTGDVTLAIANNPGGGTLLGSATVAAVGGVATFTGLSVDKSGVGYTLSANAPGAPTITSAEFDVVPGPAGQLVFTDPPLGGTAGATLAPVRVTVRDAQGNTVTGFTGEVTLAIATNPAGGTLSGTTTVAAVNGVATFSDLSISKSGTGYVLAANASGLPQVTSDLFDILPGAATRLAFIVSPNDATAGATLAAVQVAAQDAHGNVDPGFAGTVTVAIGNNAGGGALGGTSGATAAAGVATFADLSINRSGVGYTLAATASGLDPDTSDAFNIVAGTATQLAFKVQPATATAGAPIAPAVEVAARDALGNTDLTFTAPVTVAITAGTGTAGAALTGATTAPAVNGVATFASLSIDSTGSGYTLDATATGVTGATSGQFAVTAGVATQLVFTAVPAGAVAGEPFAPAVRVEARDGLGNLVPGFTGDMTVAIANNPSGGVLSGTATVAAVDGAATFPGLSIDKSGDNYTLSAAAAGLPPATSSPFNVSPGEASQLAFTGPPVGTTAGETLGPVQVTARDALGNTVTAFTEIVTLAIAANPGGGTLSGTTAVAAVGGVATFNGLSIDKAGVGYTLSATAGALPQVTSAAFDIVPGAASQLVFTGSPVSTTAGTALPPVEVTLRDALGNTATGFTGDVTMTIATNPGGGTLTGTTTVAAVSGVATFSNLSIDRSGVAYTLRAAAGALPPVTSGPFDILPGAATRLVFAVSPGRTTAGASLTPVVQVAAQDALGNVDPGFAGSVTVSIGANAGGGTLGGTTTAAAVAGVATFADLTIDKSGLGYTLAAAAAGLDGATSATFDVVAGQATQLAFKVQPATATAGAPIAPAVEVVAQDAFGNTDLAFADSVTVVITAGTGTPGATLSGTTSVAAIGGVATFATLSIDLTGGGYTLGATAAGLTGATSAAFAVVAGVATQLVFVAVPAEATAGVPFAPAVRVEARDGLGNVVPSFTADITVAIANNAGSGTLSGTKTVAAVDGAATFDGLSIDRSGVGYTLSATAAALPPATSTAFNVLPGVASQLVFTGSPVGTTAGTTLAPVQVTVRDAQGNTVTGFTDPVTVAIGTNPGGGTLSGTTAVAAVAGVATFNDLSIDKSGTGYTLSAAFGALPAGVSGAFDIAPGAAARLVFTVPPSAATAGAAIAPAVRVAAQDAFGNVNPAFSGSVTVSITAGTGTAGATLSGATTMAAVAGVATFNDLSIDKSGTGYTLAAGATGLTAGTSAPFDVAAAAPTQLAFIVQPGTTTAGAAITPAVQIAARDALGNTVTSFTGNVSVAIGTNPGSGTLSGTTTVAAVAGVATFADLSIDKSGAGYTLAASAAGPVVGTSAAFDVVAGAAAQLAFTVQPVTAIAGQAIAPAIEVVARDALGNTAAGFAGAVTMTITPATGKAGAALSGTTTVAAAAGVASFSTLSIDSAGTGYTLTAAATGLTSAVSTAFTVAGGAATQLVFTVQPGAATAGLAMTPAVEVTARDAVGNIADFTGSVTIALAVNPGPGTLSGTTTVPAVAGVARFTDLSIDKVATGYQLQAAAGPLSSPLSAAFNVGPGAATRLVFIHSPAVAEAGANIVPPVQVGALDQFGNDATGFLGNVTVALGNNPSGATLNGTKTLAAIGGVATFPGLDITLTGAGYTLTAAAAGLTGATSPAFDVVPMTVSQLVFTTQPSNGTAGVALSTVRVAARNASGETVTGFFGNVTLSIAANPAGGTLAGTTTVAAVNGVATFTGLSIDKSGTGYRLGATSGGASGTSTTFNIAAAAATQLVFTVEPSNAAVGATITPQIEVMARDALGNRVMGFTGNVSLVISTNPGGGTLGGSTTLAAASGVAAFGNLTVSSAGSGYRIAASASGLSGATSATFDITASAPDKLVFTVPPSDAVAGVAIAPAVKVTAQNGAGVTLTGYNGPVTVSITAGSGRSGAQGTPLYGTTTVSAENGVATFPDLSITTRSTGYRLSATATGFAGATSPSFTINPAAAVELNFAVHPDPGTPIPAGAVITPATEVDARDVYGNQVLAFAAPVTLALAANPGGGTLSGTTTVTPVGGTATFADLSIDKSGSGYRLAATSPGLAPDTSPTFPIAALGPTQLSFTVQPSSVVRGTSITPAVKVAARDSLGNIVTSFTGAVTLAVGANPAGGVLSGTTTVAAVSGVATFSGLSIDKAGTSYTLAATATGLAGATSAPFDILPGTQDQLVYTAQPSNAAAGVPIAPAIQVTVLDPQGAVHTTFSGNVTLAIQTNPSGGTLGGTTTVAVVSGVATFSNVTIDKVGVGYTLRATSPGPVSGVTSQAFTITAGPASRLAFAGQPSNTVAGTVISPPVQVTALDASGNVATTFAGNVTVAIGTNPSSGTLSGTLTVAAVNGVATFSNLSINRSGVGYTLRATSGTLTAATSAGFNITAGTATQLAFTGQPTNTPGGGTITPPVRVTARDALGNADSTFTGIVTVAIGNNPTGGILSGTTSVAAVSGVATFSNLSIDKVGTGYRLTATAAGLTGATSNTFNITTGPAARLVFTVQPSNAVAGVNIAPAIRVGAQDAGGNPVNLSGQVTMAIGTNPPGNGALDGTVTVNASGGLATFSNLNIDEAGNGYTLIATAGTLIPATSLPFNITPAAATRLVFTVQPTSTVAGATMAEVTVTAQDAFFNTATGFTGNVTVAIGTNPGGGTLSGTPTVAAVAGVATFGTLSINKTGTGYTLTAAASGLTGATSTVFNITPGAAATLAFTVQPSNTAAGATITPAVVVTAFDALGNVASGFTGNVMVAIGNNPGGGVLSGTATVPAVGGVATFGNLSVTSPGTAYTFTATATGVIGTTSVAFNIM